MTDDFLSRTFEALASPGVPAAPFAGPPDAPRLRHRDEVGQGEDPTNAVGSAVVPHPHTFTSIYNTVQRLYPQQAWDEAIRRSKDDAMAMRRDPFIHELLRQRQIPTAQLPFHIESDDPDDEEQGRICERIKQLIERIPNWTYLRIALLEAIFYGKAGVQIACGPVPIHGHTRRSIVRWWPVNGDKLVFDWDMTPGLLVSGLWKAPEGAHVVYGDRGRVLKLDQPRFRRGLLIHQFEPTDMDYLLETAKSTAVAGLGLRDRLYWFWWLRQEVYSYWFDGLQRISTDGNLVAYYEPGNDRSKKEAIEALKNLHRDKVAVFPRYVINGQLMQAVEALQPNQIAYAELREAVNALEDAMRRLVIGQSLTSQAEPTGLGSKVAELHDDTFTRIVRYDAKAIDETITRDLLPVLLEENAWVYRGKIVRSLPFGVRYVSEIDRPDTEQKMAAATQFAGLGGRLDLEQLGTDLGLPLDPAGQPTAQDMQAQQMMQMLAGSESKGPDRNSRSHGSPRELAARLARRRVRERRALA